MWSLMKKEFRENLPWFAIGFIAMLYVIRPFFVTDFQGNIMPIGTFACGRNFQPVLPLLNEGFLQALYVFASVYGLALGLVQTLLEERSGTYAFVLAKPIGRGKVVASKLIVGAILYLLGTCIPFCWAIYWTSVPGHFASPFRFSMSFAGWTTIGAGFLFYLGASLTGIRPARWHGSRLVGIAAAWAGGKWLCRLTGYSSYGYGGPRLTTAVLVLTVLFVGGCRIICRKRNLARFTRKKLSPVIECLVRAAGEVRAGSFCGSPGSCVHFDRS